MITILTWIGVVLALSLVYSILLGSIIKWGLDE
jgi:hypothetical protein